MNDSARTHLDRAKDYLAKGEEFYRKAKPEIDAALEEGASLREVARYLDRSKDWVADVRDWDGKGTLYGSDTVARQKRQAKQILRQASSEEIAETYLSDPDVRRKVHEAQDIAHANVTQRSREAEREAVGADIQDALTDQQVLRDAEAALFRSRRGLIDMLRFLNDHAGEIPDPWREEFLRTLDDVAAKVDLGRSLLTGGSFEDDLNQLLSKEVQT